VEQYVILIVTGLAGLLTYVVIKYLGTKLGVENLEKYYKWVCIAVNAVEQIVGAGYGEQKKAQVIDFIVNKFGNKISDEDLDKLIEAAVHEMNLVIKKLIPQPEEVPPVEDNPVVGE
jgi:LL-H family phage holin